MPEAVDLSRAVWRKSSFSNGQGGDCVEVARNLPNVVAVRDSKQPQGGALVVGIHTWTTFLAGVRAGEYEV